MRTAMQFEAHIMYRYSMVRRGGPVEDVVR